MMRRLTVLLASVVMALTLVAVATGASAAAPKRVSPPPKQQGHFYGAVDSSRAKGFVYWGHGTSKAAANKASYNACHKTGATDCQTWVWVHNGWIAYASNPIFENVGWGATKEAASKAALRRCQNGVLQHCKVDYLWQTDIDPSKQASGGYTLPGP